MTRWYDKSQYSRSQFGEVALATANSTNQTLIAANPLNFTDIYYLSFYNPSATTTPVNISDGTNNYKFAATANSLTVAYMNPVNSPISATNANTAWTCNTGLTTALSINALYVINTQ